MKEEAQSLPAVAPSELARESKVHSNEALTDFRKIFEAEFSYVCRALRRFGVAESDLEDLAQDVFISAFAKFASYDPARPVKPWLTSFAYHVASNSRRVVRYRRQLGESNAELAIEPRTPESLNETRQAQDLVLKALHGLPFEKRSLLSMHDIDGLSAGEIATLLGVPIGTVYSRVHHAREEFRTIYRQLIALRGKA